MGKTKPYDIPKKVVMQAYELCRKRGAASGFDGQSWEDFDRKKQDNLYKLWNRMSSGSYFPKPVKSVDIPKKNGDKRTLGIPTVSDRVAQMTVRLILESEWDRIFHADSYGYRPDKSAHLALDITRRRCWKYDWVIDLDIKSFFDTISHDLLLKAVDYQNPPKWTRLYIERWLKVPSVDRDGLLKERETGTPQGGVISPLLANLFLHYTFDAWMDRVFPKNPFARYADDLVIHCKTRAEAERILHEVRSRFQNCGLMVHPDKTRIVYCKDRDRTENYEETEFDFLGYTFRPRFVRCYNGRFSVSFTPAISKKAEKVIRKTIKTWNIHNLTEKELIDFSRMHNSKIRGWINYYGKFRRSALAGIWKMLNKILIKWAKNKYKRLRKRWDLAYRFMRLMIDKNRNLFEHWRLGWIYG